MGSISFCSLAVIMFVYLLIRKKIDDIIKHQTNRKTIMLLVNTVNEASQAKIFFLVDNQKSFPPTSDSGRIVLSLLSLHLGLSSGLRMLLFWSIVFFHFIITCQKTHKNMANGFNCLCIFCNVNKTLI